MTVLSAPLLAQIRTIRTQLLTDVQAGFSPDAFVAWRKNRPSVGVETWDNGGADEDWVQVGSGTGILRANGSEGPVIGEDVIYQQAPYVFRTERVTWLVAGLRLVIGTRQFHVEGVPVEDAEDPIVRAYLTEVFNEQLPGVTP